MATLSARELLLPPSEKAAGHKRSLGLESGMAVLSIPGIPAQHCQEV